ncbi:MAG: hypothetical protein F4X81_16400 [Gammaproteobacteria bacterium]|nr:hypothetical protein [Gammaproteobacteria bacterium]
MRYCLSKGMVPFLEVVVPSASTLSDSAEVLTDLDVVGIQADTDGVLRCVFFDCKSSARMSPVNRAFWAAGVKNYVGYDRAYVILKSDPVSSHRFSALSCDVDLHSESSFKDLGRRLDEAFPCDQCYQSSIDRWQLVCQAYKKNQWSKETEFIAQSGVPLSSAPWISFRHIIAELLRTKGNYDPNKNEHLAIYLDVLASVMILWCVLAKDISRFFDSSMGRDSFESVLRYYLWGGREGYQMRQQVAKLARKKTTDLPAWRKLVDFAVLTVAAPKCLLACAHAFREMSIRSVAQNDSNFDEALTQMFGRDKRVRQFMLGMNDYLISAAELPSDLGKCVESTLLNEL